MRVFCVLVPGGGGPPVRPAHSASAPRAARWARLLAVRGACVLLLVCVLVPGGGGPPARRPRRELRSARRLEARPGPATAHGHRSLALRSLRCPPHRRGLSLWVARPGSATAHGHRGLALRSLWRLPRRRRVRCCTWWRVDSLSGRTAVAGVDSRETVNTFAGVCSVSGETDDTIASQIHPFLALFHRAKASWVSYRRPEVPALVLTVTCCGAVSSMGATKFARRGLSVTIARKYAPSAGRMAQNERFIAGWASVFASVGGWGVYWANFSALRHLHQVPKPSTGTEAEPFHACLPSRPTKPAA